MKMSKCVKQFNAMKVDDYLIKHMWGLLLTDKFETTCYRDSVVPWLELVSKNSSSNFAAADVLDFLQ
jgi:hypothetical protein